MSQPPLIPADGSLMEAGHEGRLASSTGIPGTTPTGTLTYFCPFEACKQRRWFTGFQSKPDLIRHQLFHRCQWLVMTPMSLGDAENAQAHQQCSFVPQNEQALKEHLDWHLQHDILPCTKFAGDHRLTYYCPWQTCSSHSYRRKGSSNRSHVVEHVRKHATELSSEYQRRKRPSGNKEGQEVEGGVGLNKNVNTQQQQDQKHMERNQIQSHGRELLQSVMAHADTAMNSMVIPSPMDPDDQSHPNKKHKLDMNPSSSKASSVHGLSSEGALSSFANSITTSATVSSSNQGINEPSTRRDPAPPVSINTSVNATGITTALGEDGITASIDIGHDPSMPTTADSMSQPPQPNSTTSSASDTLFDYFLF